MTDEMLCYTHVRAYVVGIHRGDGGMSVVVHDADETQHTVATGLCGCRAMEILIETKRKILNGAEYGDRKPLSETEEGS
mgnify:FL=1